MNLEMYLQAQRWLDAMLAFECEKSASKGDAEDFDDPWTPLPEDAPRGRN